MVLSSISYNQIKPYIEKGLISEQVHPEDSNVRIFNYTQKCQFDKTWDVVTKLCRGFVMNIVTGEVLARPFPKFFNYAEHINNGWPIPAEEPQITEKLDGSLGIMYTLHNKVWIATRGSFTSDQAVWATNWWRKNKGEEPYGNDITYLFEIIYPENRIVVNYDFSGLVHLASIDTKTGLQVDKGMPVRSVTKVEVDNFDDLLKMDEPNSEGFVVYYPKANVRMKIKFPEYVRLHRLITGVSEIAIWELMKDGKRLDELLEKVPDEFFKWVTEVERRLRLEFATKWGRAQNANIFYGSLPTRKEAALKILEKYKDVSGAVFLLMDGEDKRASEKIWKMIRPHGKSNFKVDIDL